MVATIDPLARTCRHGVGENLWRLAAFAAAALVLLSGWPFPGPAAAETWRDLYVNLRTR